MTKPERNEGLYHLKTQIREFIRDREGATQAAAYDVAAIGTSDYIRLTNTSALYAEMLIRCIEYIEDDVTSYECKCHTSENCPKCESKFFLKSLSTSEGVG